MSRGLFAVYGQHQAWGHLGMRGERVEHANPEPVGKSQGALLSPSSNPRICRKSAHGRCRADGAHRISTRVPARGATNRVNLIAEHIEVSIHAPARGATAKVYSYPHYPIHPIHFSKVKSRFG